MEEQHEILKALREGFARVDERFAQMDARFVQIDQRFVQIDQRFVQIDERFVQIDQRFEQIDARFVQIDQRFEQIDARFVQIDQRFEQIDARFENVDEQFRTLRVEFAEKLDGVSDGLHLELQAQNQRLLERIGSVRVLVEAVDGKLGLVGENVGNVRYEIGRYHAEVETPLEHRVTIVEGRVWALEQKGQNKKA